jgi:hypothetical protein
MAGDISKAIGAISKIGLTTDQLLDFYKVLGKTGVSVKEFSMSIGRSYTEDGMLIVKGYSLGKFISTLNPDNFDEIWSSDDRLLYKITNGNRFIYLYEVTGGVKIQFQEDHKLVDVSDLKFFGNHFILVHRFLYRRNYFYVDAKCHSFDTLDEVLIKEPDCLTYYNDEGEISFDWTVVVGHSI